MSNIAIALPTEFKDWVDIIQAGFTIAAMIVGGIWTYRMFIKKREHYPGINLSITIDCMEVDASHNLVHVAILHENIKETLLKAKTAELRLMRVLPLPSPIEKNLKAGADPVSEDSTCIEWNLILERNWTFSEKAPFEIEPGESDSLYADFFVDKQVKIIQFYYYIANIEKEGKNLGWALTRYYQIPVTNRQKQNPINRLQDNSPRNEQPKLQPQQRPQPKQSPAKIVNQQDKPREAVRTPEKKKITFLPDKPLG
ncbi:MAG: hypothetical protein WCP32_01230 [Bacteroidota bacterium]